MSTHTLQTKTMLSSGSEKPLTILGLTATRDESNVQLPSKLEDLASGLAPCTTSFTIKPYLDTPYAKLVTLRPIQIINRAQLPLTFLDTAADQQYLQHNLFTAHIDVLESNEGRQDPGPVISKVLIVQYETKQTLYAVERVQARVYSICKLVPWLKEKELGELWNPVDFQACPSYSAFDHTRKPDEPWWQHAVVEAPLVEQSGKCVRMSMSRRANGKVLVKSEPQQEPGPLTFPPVETDGTVVPDPLEEPALQLPTAQEQLDSLVQQYLDAVYTSKTSLAYFVKGPITRIRTTFTSPDEGAAPTHQLVTFLRSMLLSPKASDKKYYEKLPAVIKAIPIGIVSDEEATTHPSQFKKSKKKTKLSRDGIYPLEDVFIKGWWRSEMPSAENDGEETIETRIRRRIGDLRVRETLAQMILMLEIVALESLAAYKAPTEDGSSVGESHTQIDTQTQPKKRKRKKLDDISLQLDLLLDKLSIWHVTEEAGILDFDTKSAKTQDRADGPGRGRTSDRLHGFCVEVVVPFYMSRLPEQALAINVKLGGPAIVASSKRKAVKPPLASRRSGEVKAPDAKKSRRSLARVATDTTGKTGDRKTPSLARSATDTALLRQSIKRETSEVPLSVIPFQRSPSRARQSMSQLRHLQGREMDLTSTSAAAAAKLKHKARVEDDLKEAIATLKKPNRGMAAGSYMADIEKRGLGSANRSRKPVNPVRRIANNVQVTATPRASRRTKNVIEQTPVHYRHDPFTVLAATEPAPLNHLCVQSSGVRPTSSVVSSTIQRNTTTRELAHSGIAETPSKAPTTKVFTSGAARRTIFATPVKASAQLFREDVHSTSNVFETPVKTIGSSPLMAKDITSPIIAATPVKTTVSNFGVAPIALATPAKAEEPSIYDALGWNDDDDFA